MKLDRELQLELLKKLADSYPDTRDVQRWESEFPGAMSNLAYLSEHGLCDLKTIAVSSVNVPFKARITAKGMDFLADDGGLSAILGVLTIKLHDDTIKAIIETRIMQSDLPEPAKKRMIDRLRSLGGEATKHLLLKSLDYGLDKAPDAIEKIGAWLEKAAAS